LLFTFWRKALPPISLIMVLLSFRKVKFNPFVD